MRSDGEASKKRRKRAGQVRIGIGLSFAMRRYPQRGAIDACGDAIVVEAIRKGIAEILSLEEVVTCWVI